MLAERKHEVVPLGKEGLLVANGPREDLEEVGVSLSERHEEAVQRQGKWKEPDLVKAEDDAGGDRPKKQREPLRQPRERDGLRQRAVDHHLEVLRERGHGANPDEAPKKETMNVLAVNTIARAKTIRRRDFTPLPPSPIAIPRPATMMATTPTAFATGPVSELTILVRGPSQGMESPPDAKAVEEARVTSRTGR
jgi:hypothetical protein